MELDVLVISIVCVCLLPVVGILINIFLAWSEVRQDKRDRIPIIIRTSEPWKGIDYNIPSPDDDNFNAYVFIPSNRDNLRRQ